MGIFDDIDDFFGDVGDFFFGSEDIEKPPPDPLAAKQLELLTEQQQLSSMMLPILLSEDFDVTVDNNGNIVGVVPKDPTERELNVEEIENLFAQESLKYLKGEGEVPGQVHTDFAESKKILEESLRKSLGPDYISSTPGAEAISDFEKTRIETLEGIRFGRLGELEALGLSRQAAGRTGEAFGLQKLFDALKMKESPLANIGAARGQNLAATALGAQVDIANRKEGLLGGLFRAAGGAVGQAVGGYAGSEKGAEIISKKLGWT